MSQHAASISLRSRSEEDTFAIGEALARLLPAGTTLALQGQLGGGKTHLSKGLARGLGVADWRRVTSPTFTLLHSYRGDAGRLHHMDFYRLADAGDVPQELIEALDDPNALAAAEWADLMPELLPARTLTIDFTLGDEHSRTLLLKPTPALLDSLAPNALEAALAAWLTNE